MFGPRIPLEEDDFYLNEQGFKVFTEKYHLKRGYCCKSGCKHCPYGYDKKQIHLTKNSMIKRFLVLLIAIQFSNCAQQQKVINTLPKDNILTEELISKGIHQALVNGIKKQIPKLICEDGFYRNKIVKISLDKELKDVDKRLREIGLNNLADEGVKVLNRAAEDAVKNATPIIVNTIKEISFNDPKNILLGENNEVQNT